MKGGFPMALVTTKNMFEKAFKGNYSIGAFNINNMEIIHVKSTIQQLFFRFPRVLLNMLIRFISKKW